MHFTNILSNIEDTEFKTRSNEEIWENLHTLRMLRAQCLVWYLKAKDAEELPTMFLLESEIQYLMALEAGVKWTLGLGKKNLVHPTRIAVYNQRRKEDVVEVTEGI